MEAVFQLAAEWMRSNSTVKLSNEQKLKLYGLFKQATEGPCTTSKPGIFDLTGRAKWEAWHTLGSMSVMEAIVKYIELVKTLDPQWKNSGVESGVDKIKGGTNPGRRGGGGGTGPVVSTLMNSVDVIPDEEKNIFDWCKEGHVTKLATMVTQDNVNSLDEQGMSLMHWACDRGHLEVVQLLLERDAEVNQQDRDLQTPLHYAVCCGHVELITFLLSRNDIDKDLKDCDGAVPAEVTPDPSIRALFANISNENIF